MRHEIPGTHLGSYNYQGVNVFLVGRGWKGCLNLDSIHARDNSLKFLA